MTKEIRVEIKVRNNLILSKMDDFGIFSVSDLAGRIQGISRDSLYRIISMKMPARNPNGSWCKAAIVLSDFFQCMPEELFSSDQQLVALETNRATAEMGFAEIQQLMSSSFRPDQLAEALDLKRVIHQQLLKLTEREQRVITLRFGLNGESEHTLEAIGHKFGTTREVIRQIEARALRKLKHPTHSRPIKNALGAVDKRGRWYGDTCPRDSSEVFDGEVINAMNHV